MSNVSVFNRFGVDVSGMQDINDVLDKAGMNWDVTRDDLFVQDPANPEGRGILVPGVKAIRRTDNKVVLSVMSDRYRPVTTEDKKSFYKALVGSGKAEFERALSFNGGRKIALTAKLGSIMKVGPDDINKYFALFDSFDGTLPFGVMITPIRIVCQNTLTLALKTSQTMFKIRHSVNVNNRVEEAMRALGMVETSYKTFGERADQLLKQKFNDAQMKDLALTLFPQKGDDDSEVGSRLTQARAKVTELFTEGAGHGGIRGTAWAAYNGVVEYVDHHRGGRVSSGRAKEESGVDAILFGSGAGLKAQALSFITKAA